MATTTTNLELTLPAGTENVSRQIINTNMQKIDTAFGELDDRQVQVRTATGTVSSVAALANADVSCSISSAFTNGADTYFICNNSSSVINPICLMSWTDNTHPNIRVFNYSNNALSNISVTIKILGVKA